MYAHVSNRWRAVNWLVRTKDGPPYPSTDIGAIEYILDRCAYLRDVNSPDAVSVIATLNPVFKLLTGGDIVADLDREQVEFDAS